MRFSAGAACEAGVVVVLVGMGAGVGAAAGRTGIEDEGGATAGLPRSGVGDDVVDAEPGAVFGEDEGEPVAVGFRPVEAVVGCPAFGVVGPRRATYDVPAVADPHVPMEGCEDIFGVGDDGLGTLGPYRVQPVAAWHGAKLLLNGGLPQRRRQRGCGCRPGRSRRFSRDLIAGVGEVAAVVGETLAAWDVEVSEGIVFLESDPVDETYFWHGYFSR